MGFRSGAYARIWEIEQKSASFVKGRISINYKNKQTGEYEQDFSGFVSFIGTACADHASKLEPKDMIRIGDCDVSTKYDRDKRVTYTNFKIFSFADVENTDSPQPRSEPTVSVDDGELDEEDASLPF